MSSSMARDFEMEKPGDDSAGLFDILEMMSDEGGGDDAASSEQDARDMQRLGNRQEFKRSFHSLSILGLTCVLISTWMAILATSEFSLINGGRAGTIWIYIISWVCTLTVVASLAEMASMAPTAGGQYHWVSEFAPPSIQKPLSYLSGWLAALGWQSFVAGSAYQASVIILLMVQTAHANYSPTLWQETLLILLVGIVCVLFNLFGANKLPLFEGIVLCLYVLGFFAIGIPLWVLAPKVPAKEVFFDFSNYGGWSSTAAAVIIGQSSAATALIGVDSAAHMSEEVRSAAKTVPRMMFLTIFVNGILGFVMIMTFTFVVTDIDRQLLQSASPYPFIEVFAEATSSSTAAIGMTVAVVVMTFSMCINSIMAASRQCWSFARDNGLPFSKWFTKITVISSTPLPVNAMLFSLIILLVIALLNLGGSLIVSSLIGLLTGAVGTTYCISIGCVIWRRLFGEPLPPAKWSLGPLGLPINIFALLYQATSTILCFFPLAAKPDAKGMNWSVVVFAGVLVVAIVNYIVYGRKVYRGPVVRILKDD